MSVTIDGGTGSVALTATASGASLGTTLIVPAGSAGAPSVVATGDTNTGVFFPAADTVALATGGTERVRVPSSGGVQAVTTISVGNATPSTSGAGITFPATQSASTDANTLDDYEEGDWTPTIIGTTTAGTGTYNSQQGKYRKIGGVVIVQGYVDWSAHTGTGNMRISNLPFTTAASSNSAASFGFVDCPALTAGNVLVGYTASSSVAIVLRQYATGGGAGADVPMDTAAGIVFSVSYAV